MDSDELDSGDERNLQDFKDFEKKAMTRLDEARIKLPGPYDGPSFATLKSRYAARQTEVTLEKNDIPWVLRQLTDTHSDSDW